MIKSITAEELQEINEKNFDWMKLFGKDEFKKSELYELKSGDDQSYRN